MIKLPARFRPYAFGVIQSGLTCAVAAAIASAAYVPSGMFLSHWLRSWLLAWITMVPIVLLAAPFIQRLARSLTRDD